jgi:hypothetical protein
MKGGRKGGMEGLRESLELQCALIRRDGLNPVQGMLLASRGDESTNDIAYERKH